MGADDNGLVDFPGFGGYNVLRIVSSPKKSKWLNLNLISHVFKLLHNVLGSFYLLVSSGNSDAYFLRQIIDMVVSQISGHLFRNPQAGLIRRGKSHHCPEE